MSKISIETKYQKSPSFPIVLNVLRLNFKMDDFLGEKIIFHLKSNYTAYFASDMIYFAHKYKNTTF